MKQKNSNGTIDYDDYTEHMLFRKCWFEWFWFIPSYVYEKVTLKSNCNYSTCYFIDFVAGHSAFAIKFANMQMTVFHAKRLAGETFGISSSLGGTLFLATSQINFNQFNFCAASRRRAEKQN